MWSIYSKFPIAEKVRTADENRGEIRKWIETTLIDDVEAERNKKPLVPGSVTFNLGQLSFLYKFTDYY